MINFSINLFNALLDKIILLRYKKKFKNYQSAKEYCEKHTNKSYNNEELNNFRFEKFKNNKDLIPYTFNNSLFALLESVSLFLNNNKEFPKTLEISFAKNPLILDDFKALPHKLDRPNRKKNLEIKLDFYE